jgi:hypothetical protein
MHRTLPVSRFPLAATVLLLPGFPEPGARIAFLVFAFGVLPATRLRR